MEGIKFKLSTWLNSSAFIRPIIIIAVLAAICLILAGIQDDKTEGFTSSSSDASLESRLSRALSSIEGAGRVSVIVNGAQGVLVVAQGADDIAVKLEIIRAVKTLLGIDASRIEVLAMEGG